MKRPLSTTEKIRMEKKGRRERYALKEFCDHINSRATDFYFQLLLSQENKSVVYDGIIYVRNKYTNEIQEMYIVEAKVRTETYSKLILEYDKHIGLKTERMHLMTTDQTNYKPKIMYINFCPDKTYMFFVDEIESANLLPQIQKSYMNEITVADNKKKIEKEVYYLDTKLAIKKNFVFTDEAYTRNLIDNIHSSIEIIKDTNQKFFSIF